MKVGTDGVLLGAWISAEEEVVEILDIGTGTGLIAIMLAQKFSGAHIEGIDIDESAYLQAKLNAGNSNWKKRIHIEKIALEDFIVGNKKKYNIIACNPPYFKNGWKIEIEGRKKARDAAFLPLEQLINVAIKCLGERGSLNIIIPVEEGKTFIELFDSAGLYCKRKTTVYTKDGGAAKRFLFEIVKYPVTTLSTDLIIEHKGLNNYSDAYKQLTRDFYLNF